MKEEKNIYALIFVQVSKGYKCGEEKLFYIDYKEEEANEHEPSSAKEIEEITLTISCHALDLITTPQTLKIK